MYVHSACVARDCEGPLVQVECCDSSIAALPAFSPPWLGSAPTQPPHHHLMSVASSRCLIIGTYFSPPLHTSSVPAVFPSLCASCVSPAASRFIGPDVSE